MTDKPKPRPRRFIRYRSTRWTSHWFSVVDGAPAELALCGAERRDTWRPTNRKLGGCAVCEDAHRKLSR